MSEHERFEQLLADVLAETAPTRVPDRLVPEILRAARRERRRPRWLALMKEPPMRLSSRTAIGSPVARALWLSMLLSVAAVLVAGTMAVGVTLLGPRTIVVDDDGTADVTTITEAVAMAEDGDTILVRPGTYVGSLVITKDITIRGEGDRQSVTIQFDASSPIVPSWTTFGPVPYGILVVDATVGLSDLLVVGPNVAAAFALVGGETTIERVALDLEGSFSGSPQTGIALFNNAAATITDCRCDDNPVWEIDHLQPYAEVEGSGVLIIRRVVNQWGIWVTPAEGSVIEDNVTTGWITIGEDGETGSLLVARNTAQGIDVMDSGPALVLRENVLTGGRKSGPGVGGDTGSSIAIQSGSAIIERNQVRGSQNGIWLFQDASATIADNVIEDNGIGVLLNRGSRATVVGNRFCRNLQTLVERGADPTLDPSNTICPPGTSPAP